jgi:hypothetical protein
MLLVPTPARFKLLQACGQLHSSRESTFLPVGTVISVQTQKGKLLINDLLETMGERDPELLMELIANPVYNAVLDVLLGFSAMGAFTAHWIEGEGDRQLSHVGTCSVSHPPQCR